MGLAPASAGNPLSRCETPFLRSLLGGEPLTTEAVGCRPELILEPLDAGLGVDGLPQSATGQTALLTGVNAARTLGRHQSALPGAVLRGLLAQHSLFSRLVDLGLKATFANAYTDETLERMGEGRGRVSATTWAVRAADLPLRRARHLETGSAVAWDVCRDLFSRRTAAPVERVDPRAAGGHLAAIAADHDFTLFETFLTDLAGHGRRGLTAAEALRRVDGLLAGVEESRDQSLTWLVTSDHGNLEDSSSGRHTRHPVPLLVRGPLAEAFSGLESIADLTPRILEVLGSPGEHVPT